MKYITSNDEDVISDKDLKRLEKEIKEMELPPLPEIPNMHILRAISNEDVYKILEIEFGTLKSPKRRQPRPQNR